MNIALLFELTKRDFLERYVGSALGSVWAFLWPLVNIFIYVVIFSKVMGAKLPGQSATYSYSIYLVAGLVPWTAFANSVARATTVYVDRRNILSKITVDLPTLPLCIILSESITFLISMSIFLVFLLLTGKPLNGTVLFVPLVFILQQLFAYGVGFLAAIFNVFLRDLKEAVGVLIQIWFWFTPIVYTLDIVPEVFKKYFSLNPAMLFIESYQKIFVYNISPSWGQLSVLAGISLSLLTLAWLVFQKLEKDVRDFL
jgi:lipopolysaccharide transport system permease protein